MISDTTTYIMMESHPEGWLFCYLLPDLLPLLPDLLPLLPEVLPEVLPEET